MTDAREGGPTSDPTQGSGQAVSPFAFFTALEKRLNGARVAFSRDDLREFVVDAWPMIEKRPEVEFWADEFTRGQARSRAPMFWFPESLSEAPEATEKRSEVAEAPRKRIGYLFDGAVHIVFQGEDGRQYFLMGECPIYGNFLPAGEDWASWATPPEGGTRPVALTRRAYHEAGHAAVCLGEGIGVEYVTIAPSAGKSGYCHYDHAVPDLVRNDPGTYAEKVARMMLAGMEAEKLFLEQAELSPESEHSGAWSQDFSAVKKLIADLSIRQERDVDVGAEILRLGRVVRERLREPSIWGGVALIADQLMRDLAISGKHARRLVDRARES
jgi:hypothetical protein